MQTECFPRHVIQLSHEASGTQGAERISSVQQIHLLTPWLSRRTLQIAHTREVLQEEACHAISLVSRWISWGRLVFPSVDEHLVCGWQVLRTDSCWATAESDSWELSFFFLRLRQTRQVGSHSNRSQGRLFVDWPSRESFKPASAPKLNRTLSRRAQQSQCFRIYKFVFFFFVRIWSHHRFFFRGKAGLLYRSHMDSQVLCCVTAQEVKNCSLWEEVKTKTLTGKTWWNQGSVKTCYPSGAKNP